MGLKTREKAYLAVWRREGGNAYQEILLPEYQGEDKEVTCIYPDCNESRFEWQSEAGKLSVHFAQEKMARLFVISG